MAEGCKDYSSLNLNIIKKPSVILHKKYVQTLCIFKDPEHMLDFKPTRYLKLHISHIHSKSSNLIEYLNVNSLENLHSEVILEELEGV